MLGGAGGITEGASNSATWEVDLDGPHLIDVPECADGSARNLSTPRCHPRESDQTLRLVESRHRRCPGQPLQLVGFDTRLVSLSAWKYLLLFTPSRLASCTRICRPGSALSCRRDQNSHDPTSSARSVIGISVIRFVEHFSWMASAI